METYPRKLIALGQLNVDLGNFRIGEFENSRDAYKAMIEEEREALINLADDILENGLSPAEPLIVGPDSDNKGQYIVFEGNRRLTALKLMLTPALAAGTMAHGQFQKLGRRFSTKPILEVEAVVMPDKDSALLWIERKHTTMGGRGISKWSAPAQGRFEAYQGAHRPSKAVIDHLTNAGKITPSLQSQLKRKTTNIDRVFQMPYFRTKLGIEISDKGEVQFANGNQRAGNQLLLDVLHDLAPKKVDAIKTKDQRLQFIDQFLDRSVAAPPKDSKPESGKPKAAKATKATKTSARPSGAAHRTTLAPTDKGTAFPISDPRLAQLYDEARRLNSDRFPAIAAVLFRVFLELSTDYYLIKFKVKRPKKYEGKNWNHSSIPLKEKIRCALANIDPTGTASELKTARQGLTDDERLHAVQGLHEFVHALTAAVTGKEARTIWDRWHKYLEKLHQALADAGA